MADQPIEDVLASIRKLMLDEAPPAPVAPEPDPPHASAGGHDDVLELTQPLPPEPPRPPVRPTGDASRQALAYLSTLRLVDESGDDTLAGLVREMLKPMLAAWLDAELPAIVERLVVQEIARASAVRE